MVRVAVLAWSLCCALPAAAQSADWSTSGGALFPDQPASLRDAEPQDVTRVPALSQPFMALIEQAATAHGLDPKLLHALVLQESGYDPRAVSQAGAGGLTQLMPGTARDLGVADRFDPVANLYGGAEYLARQINRFGDLRLALAAYNAGPGRVARRRRIPDIAETRDYVDIVIDCYLALSAGRSIAFARDCRSGARRP